MTVHELLSKMDSRELSEWKAYERVAGPLSNEWDRDLQLSKVELKLKKGTKLNRPWETWTDPDPVASQRDEEAQAREKQAATEAMKKAFG